MIQTIPLSNIKYMNEKAGKFFFSPDTTRFFHSKYPQYAYKKDRKAFFITSEQFDAESPRKFTIRVADLDTGEVKSFSDFQAFGNRQSATDKLKELL